MNQDYLQQFRQQLAAWVEEQLAVQRLPFQRLEICPEILTGKGILIPDIVLWINRDSQLAGSIILLPKMITEEVLSDAVEMSKALGLGHFTTWDAKEIRIWETSGSASNEIQNFCLPPVNKIHPDDFVRALECLLEELKVVTITTAPATTEYSIYYYANLCLRTLHVISPGLAESARLSGGQTADDNWIERAPIEKAWLSLWRILFLLCVKRLPPGIQPDRIEQAFHYAIEDLGENCNLLSYLKIGAGESPLTDADAVKLHHLACRMSQIGWPDSKTCAIQLITLLAEEAAEHYQLADLETAGETDKPTLWVNTRPPGLESNSSIVAPRAYLAGIALITHMIGNNQLILAENLQSISSPEKFNQAIAKLTNAEVPDRKTHETKLLLLRKAWPNRRFDFPPKTPAWIIDVLYLAGIVEEKLIVVLPSGWHSTPGIEILWNTLRESHRLTDIALYDEKFQLLSFSQNDKNELFTKVHQTNASFIIRSNGLDNAPAATQIWLNAAPEIINYLLEKSLADSSMIWTDSTRWGAFLFLNTRLGRHLWTLCTGQSALPGFDKIMEAIELNGLPVPDEMALQDLSLYGSMVTGEIPSKTEIEEILAGIWGVYPELPESGTQTGINKPKGQRKSKFLLNQIIEKVFVDGVPRFPEYYLMNSYKPELATFDLEGPLEYAEDFFDKVYLRPVHGGQRIEVSGRLLADALILASWTNQTAVGLPQDQALLEKITREYRNDLQVLWDKLTRECRRVEPQRQSARKLARKIWTQLGLPPKNLFCKT